MHWYTCKPLLNTLGSAVEHLAWCMPCQGRKSQQSKSKHNSHANHASAKGYRWRNRFNRARRVSQARSRLSSIPTGCCLLLSVTKMPASDTVLQELKHQVLLIFHSLRCWEPGCIGPWNEAISLASVWSRKCLSTKP